MSTQNPMRCRDARPKEITGPGGLLTQLARVIETVFAYATASVERGPDGGHRRCQSAPD